MNSKLDIQSIRETIERQMAEKGFSRRSLSTAAGLSQTAVRDVLDRTENPGIGTLFRIAEALQIPVEHITGSGGVPLLGKIGAGGSIIFEPEDSHDIEHVARPPLGEGRLAALEVVGDSMLPKYDPGDIVYVRRDHEGVLPEYLGEYCAVGTSDGGTWLKILSPGTEAGRYTLRSLNAADMVNVEVMWASPVLWVMPRRTRLMR